MAGIVEAEQLIDFNIHEGKKLDQSKRVVNRPTPMLPIEVNASPSTSHYMKKKPAPKESTSKELRSSSQKLKHGCFLCGGPHKATDCPIKGSIDKNREQRAKGKEVIEVED